MFNFGYAIIGFLIGWIISTMGIAKTRGAGSAPLWASRGDIQAIPSIALIIFLIFSGSFGFEWLLAALAEVFVGFVSAKVFYK